MYGLKTLIATAVLASAAQASPYYPMWNATSAAPYSTGGIYPSVSVAPAIPTTFATMTVTQGGPAFPTGRPVVNITTNVCDAPSKEFYLYAVPRSGSTQGAQALTVFELDQPASGGAHYIGPTSQPQDAQLFTVGDYSLRTSLPIPGSKVDARATWTVHSVGTDSNLVMTPGPAPRRTLHLDTNCYLSSALYGANFFNLCTAADGERVLSLGHAGNTDCTPVLVKASTQRLL